MTQTEQLIDLFRRHGRTLTLRQILNTTLAAEYRARMSELRRAGYIITCQKGKQASDNLYRMIEPEADGQMRFA
jgi:hypothetical protein